MSEKEKPKRSTRMGFLRSCLIFSLYPLLIFTIFGIGFVYWAIGGYVKPSLDLQYIPAAEYLLASSTGDLTTERGNNDVFFRLYLDFNPNEICFGVTSTHDKDFQNLLWAEIYINEQVLARFYPSWGDYVLYDGLSGDARHCVGGHLDSGLHIIEFRAKESLFAEPYYIQRWAIEIP